MPSDPRDQVLITATALARLLRERPGVVVLAVRNPRVAADAALPRIPGALDVDLPSELAGPGGGTRGSRPLPELADLQAYARRWGLSADSFVVVYDHDRGLQAARGWWVLRWAGVAQVRLLDGGFAAWQTAGLPMATEPGLRSPGDITLTGGGLKVLDADQAAALAARGRLIDTRIRANYIGGITAPGEARRGHIPGSLSAPAIDNLTEAGGFTDAATLRHLYAAHGLDDGGPVGVSCGAGISAAHAVAALASIGIEAAMYPGSWSAWAADPARPVAIGGRP
ncbi:sulfurtransferase [Roseomonas sp. F4]